MLAPSGEQFEIVHGRQRATVVEVGGGIRTYTDGDRDVLDPYPIGAMSDGAHGAPLLPWPNRIGEGRYRFGGREYQLDVSEPDLGNAIHGLMRWRPWQAVSYEPSAVVMGARLHPSPGYPFCLDLRVAYRLDDAGLAVEMQARNVGQEACPFAAGQHVYLSAGSAGIDAATLQFAAATRIATDPVHRLPTGHSEVAGTAVDYARPRRLGRARMDDPFFDLVRDRDGRAWVRLWGADGRRVDLWQDAAFACLQVYTGDSLEPARRRRALAAEPMTAPPDAFRSGEGLIVLAPGQDTTARWGVRLV